MPCIKICHYKCRRTYAVNVTDPTWLNNVDCPPWASRLIDCASNPGVHSFTCSGGNIVVLSCSGCLSYTCSDGSCATLCDGVQECPEGDDEADHICQTYTPSGTVLYLLCIIQLYYGEPCLVRPPILRPPFLAHVITIDKYSQSVCYR